MSINIHEKVKDRLLRMGLISSDKNAHDHAIDLIIEDVFNTLKASIEGMDKNISDVPVDPPGVYLAGYDDAKREFLKLLDKNQ